MKSYAKESNVKEHLSKEQSMRMSKKYIGALNQKIFVLIDESIERARENHRKTVFACDL